jgi:iron complex outermembrane receptor protein
MKNITYYYILALSLTFTNLIAQQKNTIKGSVTDGNNLPIIGALIKVKNTSDATVTDISGKYNLLTNENYPLIVVISGFGFKEKEIEVQSTNNDLTVKLEDESVEFETITITARRRKESPIDVPISVTTIGGAQAEDAGAFNVNRVKELVPTVQLYSSNPRNTTLNIRGLGSTFGLTNDGLDPGVGFYIDGVYYARPAATALDFVDIESIEVLRGPQGTLFGKNTSSGAFNITTRAPQFETGGIAEVSYGNFGYIQAKTSITGPIYKNKLAGRVSFSGTQRDGTIFNTYNNKYVNDLNNLGVRASLLYKIKENNKLTLIYDANRQQPNEGYAQVLVGVVPTQRAAYRQFGAIAQDLNWQIPGQTCVYPNQYDFSRQINQNSTWRAGNNMGGGTLNGDFKVGKGTLTTTSAFRYWNWDPLNDRDFTGLNATAKSQATSRHEQWSQEVRYAGNITEKISGVVGLYYIHQHLWTDPEHIEEAGEHQWRFQQNTTNTALWSTPGLFDGHGSAIRSRLRTQSAAAFANFDWAVTNKLHILPGFRYNYDTKQVDFNRRAYGLFQTTDPELLAIRSIYTNQSFNFSTQESNVTGQLTVSFKANDKVNTFATVSNSFKPIGVNLGGLPNKNGEPDLTLAQVKPEYTQHYEIGIKTSPTKFSGFNLVIHRSDIKNYQTLVQDPDPSILRGYLANAESVKVQGIEVDGNISINNHISLNAAFAYTDGKYVSFKNAPLPLEETGAVDENNVAIPFKDISGERLPGISKYAGTFGAELSTKKANFLGKTGKYFMGADTYYRSEFSSSPTPSKYLNIDGYALFNARLGFRATDGLTAIIWARNLLNKNYFEQLLPGAGNSGHYAGVLGDPRTYGVTVRYKF